MRKGFKKVLEVGLTTLILGSIAANLHVIPPKYVAKFADDKPYDQVYDVEKFENCNDFFMIPKLSFGDYVDNNQMYFTNSEINVSIDEKLSFREKMAGIKAVQFYQELFNVINPNAKINFVQADSKEIDVSVIYGGLNTSDNAVMTTKHQILEYPPDKNGNVLTCLPNERTNKRIVVWSRAKASTKSFVEKAMMHEFLHVFGIKDHNGDGEHIGDDPCTIMNYNDIQALSKISPNENKLTPSDYFALVQLYSPFANHEHSGIQNAITETEFYHNEQEYNEYINSKMADFCYSQKELDMISQVKQNNFSNYSIADVVENEATKDWFLSCF